jgi:hypothetical protein
VQLADIFLAMPHSPSNPNKPNVVELKQIETKPNIVKINMLLSPVGRGDEGEFP